MRHEEAGLTELFSPAAGNLWGLFTHTFDQSGSPFISRRVVTQLTMASLSKSVNFAILHIPTQLCQILFIKPTLWPERPDERDKRTSVNTAECASPQLIKETPRGLRAGTTQMLNLPVKEMKWWYMMQAGALHCTTPSEFRNELRSVYRTCRIHPVEPQLARFIGPTAVHQAWESEEQSVGRSSWNLGHRYSCQRGHQDRSALQRHLFPQAQLTKTVQTPWEDIPSWKWNAEMI